MELANSGFGSELSNNTYSNLTSAEMRARVIKKTGPVAKPISSVIAAPKEGPMSPGLPGGGTPVVVAPIGLPVVPVYSEPPSTSPTSPTPSGGSGGSGGSGSETGSETGEEKSVEATEEKTPETTTSKAVVEEVSFFKKPIGKVTALILLVALAYGGYRVMKSKGIIK